MSPILSLEKISKRFGAVVVADGIDLALNQGEALGIIGPNGAGKTTLFGIVTGTVAPDTGRVVFAGDDITRVTPERRCRMGIARSFQIPQPFGGMTVFENLVVAAAFGGGKRERDVYARCAEDKAWCGKVVQETGGKVMELEGRRKNGDTFPLEANFSKWEGVDGFQYGAVMRDISDRKREAERIRYLAEHDTLTGLANRHMLYEHLNAKLAETKTEPVALLVLDLDKFKQINDTLGHACGDQLLSAVAQRLNALIEGKDLVARVRDRKSTRLNSSHRT